MYLLMCKDDIRATFDLVKKVGYEVINLNIIGLLPIGCTSENFLSWLESRHASKHRKHLVEYLQRIGCKDVVGFLNLTHGISINDCYWVKKEAENIQWADVSPYTNEFDEVVQHLAFDGTGLYGEQFSSVSPEFGTSGAFDKCWVKEDSNIYLIKRGSTGAANSGLEPYCEVLASQIFKKMRAGIPYKLVNYHGKVASKCKIFNTEAKSFVPYGKLPKVRGDLQYMLDYYDMLNTTLFRRILICDALTLNTDRHVGNHGVLCNSVTNTILSSAPGYDYNMAMLPYVMRDDFVGISTQIKSCIPKIGDDFLFVAKSVLTSDIRKDLAALRGIDLHLDFYDEKFPKERVKWMSSIVNEQINNILYNREPIYPTIKVDGLSNTMKYRMKLHLTEDEWFQQVPTLMKLFGISHMEELEKEIVHLL